MAPIQSVDGSVISGYMQMNHSYILCLWYSVCEYTKRKYTQLFPEPEH